MKESWPCAYIVTASDSRYFRFLLGFCHSFYNFYQNNQELQLLVIDTGLRDWEKIDLLKTWPDCLLIDINAWDWEATFSTKFNSLETLGFSYRPWLPELVALTLKRSLRDQDVIIWMDVDTWLQTPDSLLTWISVAQENYVGITTEISITKPRGETSHSAIWGYQLYERYYPNSTSLTACNILNAGIFSAAVQNSFWEQYRSALLFAWLKGSTFQFGMDQIALNYAIHSNQCPFISLPFIYNWLVPLHIPVIDPVTRLLYSSLPPYELVHIIHLANNSKWERYCISTIARNSLGQFVKAGKEEILFLDWFAVQQVGMKGKTEKETD